MTNHFETSVTPWHIDGIEVSGSRDALRGADNVAVVSELGLGKCLHVSGNAAVAGLLIRYRAEKLEVCALVRLDALRRAADRAALRRSRPLLLSLRGPGTLDHCLHRGLDLRGWLREGLLDLLVISGGYFPFSTPWQELVSLARAHNVPAYACLSQSAMRDARNTIHAWRAAAAGARHCGAAGIYLFNCFDPASPIWRELGDPAYLADKDKD